MFDRYSVAHPVQVNTHQFFASEQAANVHFTPQHDNYYS
jgi:hypothetical protein